MFYATITTIIRTATTALVAAGCALQAGDSPTPSPVQSNGSPYGLTAVAPVMMAGSDQASAVFQQQNLTPFRSFLSGNLSNVMSRNGYVRTDPARLRLVTDTQIRAYFVGESTDDHNSIGFATQGTGILGSNPQLIFPDASDPIQEGYTLRNNYAYQFQPLRQGDFVNMGTFTAGTDLDLFVVPNGRFVNFTGTYSSDPSENSDLAAHMLAYTSPDSPYLILAMDDVSDGVRDFSDTIIALNLGVDNIRALVSGPEPATWAMLAGLGLLVLVMARRKNGVAYA